GDRGPDRMQLKFEGGRDPEIATTAAYRPEQVGVLVRSGFDDFAGGGDERHRAEIVERQPVFAHQPAEPAAQPESRDAGCASAPPGPRQTVQLRFAVELAPGAPALRPYFLPIHIDMDAAHRRQIDHQPAIDGGASGDIVAAAADRDCEVELASEPDGI